MTTSTTDRIEQTIQLPVPVSRVWRALTNVKEFGEWFRVNLEGKFVPGARLKGPLLHSSCGHTTMEIQIERMEPERLFSYRWHPYAVDPKADYASEPTTLVEFHLSATPTGSQLVVIESGFDAIPVARRSEALRMNTAGWAGQMKNIERHVSSK